MGFSRSAARLDRQKSRPRHPSATIGESTSPAMDFQKRRGSHYFAEAKITDREFFNVEVIARTSTIFPLTGHPLAVRVADHCTLRFRAQPPRRPGSR